MPGIPGPRLLIGRFVSFGRVHIPVTSSTGLWGSLLDELPPKGRSETVAAQVEMCDVLDLQGAPAGPWGRVWQEEAWFLKGGYAFSSKVSKQDDPGQGTG